MRFVPRLIPTLTFAVLVVVGAACTAKAVRSTAQGAPADGELAQLWHEPSDPQSRDLFYGSGGKALVPDPRQRWEYVAADTTGSSRGWDVRDEHGMKWDVKLGVEAQPEVVVSRLHWAIGYHQLPTYYVEGWSLTRDGKVLPQPPGRFRPKLRTHKKAGEWSWQENPFVDTVPFRGLVVLNLMVNNWDLKTSNNTVYELDQEREGARRWYVVKDVGASLGKTPGRILDGTPNDVDGFERQGFIEGVSGGHVRFDYIRPHTELVDLITPRDVRWTCERLGRLTSQQWSDVFRAAGYDQQTSARYVRKLQAKIAAGMSLSQ